jgi:uncharacterized protein YjbJ (UPF0337 family)
MKDYFEGKWHQMKGKIKQKWGRLTDDDITQINGKHEQLVGKLQTKYGYAKDQAEKEINRWKTEHYSEGSSSNQHKLQSNHNEKSNDSSYGKKDIQRPHSDWDQKDRYGNDKNHNKGQNDDDFRDKKRKVG